MGRAIFISYRRDDTEGEAGRLFDDLVRSFGEDSVFMDVAGINPGVDFRKAIDDNVAGCGVLLAMIGPAWCSIKNADGTRRLDDPNDFVRLEIASALARDVAVIPVLVHDAKMPRPTDLPENLKNLAFRNSVEVTHARWNSDVQLLTAALGRYVAPAAATDTAPVHATVAVQLPPPTPPAQKDRSSPSNIPLILGIGAAVVVALGIVAFFLFRPNPASALPRHMDQHDTGRAERPGEAGSLKRRQPGTSDACVGQMRPVAVRLGHSGGHRRRPAGPCHMAAGDRCVRQRRQADGRHPHQARQWPVSGDRLQHLSRSPREPARVHISKAQDLTVGAGE